MPKQSGAVEAINAVLSPWKDTEASAEDIEYITENLTGHYGDPRVRDSGVWAGVAPELTAVVVRWLTGQNIRFFLKVVSHVESSHMWEPRRRFWLALHDNGDIDAAWVALSRSGAEVAGQWLDRRSDRNNVRFGHQTARGSRSNTSLLIMKIGQKIVIEGSHNYRVHIFKEGSRGTPRLWEETYDCEQIRLTPGAETRAHIGDWQAWVSQRI